MTVRVEAACASGEDGFGERELGWMGEGLDELFPRVVSGENFDMDAEVERWNGVARVGFWEADGVFFGGEERV